MIKPMIKYLLSLKNLNPSHISPWIFDYVTTNKGLTGAGTLDVISNVCKFIDRDKAYLEVGIYQAVNLVGVAKRNSHVFCYGVDNFCQQFEENKNFPNMTGEEVVRSKIKDTKNVDIAVCDFREFLTKNDNIHGKKAEVYFFDGPHAEQDQIDGLEMAIPILADDAVVFIDDWNCPTVDISIKYMIEKYPNNWMKLLGLRGNGDDYFSEGQYIMIYNRNGFTK